MHNAFTCFLDLKVCDRVTLCMYTITYVCMYTSVVVRGTPTSTFLIPKENIPTYILCMYVCIHKCIESWSGTLTTFLLTPCAPQRCSRISSPAGRLIFYRQVSWVGFRSLAGTFYTNSWLVRY